MATNKKLRAELEDKGVITSDLGLELARLTLNGILVINLAELFFEVERWSINHGYKCSLNHLCIVFGRAGTWSYDPAVYGAVNQMIELGVLEELTGGFVKPKVTATRALKLLPPYVSRAEAHAGLEHIDE